MSSCDFNIVVMEDVFEAVGLVENYDIAIVEDVIKVGCVPGSGEGSYLMDHDGILILDHDGNKIPI